MMISFDRAKPNACVRVGPGQSAKVVESMTKRWVNVGSVRGSAGHLREFADNLTYSNRSDT